MKPAFKPLNEQVIVITGASSGIGLATALAAASDGASLVLAARSGEVLDRVVEETIKLGAKAIAVETDVADRAQVQRLAATAVQSYGRIDTWVNDAGLGLYGRIDEVDLEDGRRLFDINFWGVVHGSLAALPHLRASCGALINLGSETSEVPVPLQGLYSASKHAVKGFTDALRIELEADDAPVSVTLIEPTAIDTPFPEHAGNYLSQEPKLPTPMLEPEKVASAILDAATSAARDVKVGTMAKLNATLAKAMPSLFDVMARQQLGRQQRDEAPHVRQGTLYHAGCSGRIRGRGNERAADTRSARASNVRLDA